MVLRYPLITSCPTGASASPIGTEELVLFNILFGSNSNLATRFYQTVQEKRHPLFLWINLGTSSTIRKFFVLFPTLQQYAQKLGKYLSY